MKGYLNDSKATAEAIDADGWLHTGDLGYLDADGALHFQGRLKDTVRIGGEIVAAREIERVLESHARIRAAHVVAIPDDRYGEVPYAFVEIRTGEWDTDLEAELSALASNHLAHFKTPRGYEVCQDVPITQSGKVQKRLLRDRYLSRGPS